MGRHRGKALDARSLSRPRVSSKYGVKPRTCGSATGSSRATPGSDLADLLAVSRRYLPEECDT